MLEGTSRGRYKVLTLPRIFRYFFIILLTAKHGVAETVNCQIHKIYWGVGV